MIEVMVVVLGTCSVLFTFFLYASEVTLLKGKNETEVRTMYRRAILLSGVFVFLGALLFGYSLCVLASACEYFGLVFLAAGICALSVNTAAYYLTGRGGKRP